MMAVVMAVVMVDKKAVQMGAMLVLEKVSKMAAS